MRSLSDLDRRILSEIASAKETPPLALAVEIFTHQFETIPSYREFCRKEGFDLSRVRTIWEIPPLPTQAFKHARLATFPPEQTAATFETSGTTTEKRGRHSFDTLELVDASSKASFERFLSSPHPFSWISLVPSTWDLPHSSLAHMIDRLARRFSDGQVLYPFDEGVLDLAAVTEGARTLGRSPQPIFVAATTAALSDWLDHLEHLSITLSLPRGSALFETGGRKGRRYLPTSDHLATKAERLLALPRDRCFGEYGMTEISTPAWGKLHGPTMLFSFPPWCPARIVDPTTLEEVEIGQEGLVRIFDFANRGSVSALFTGDWGRRHPEGFEVLGRAAETEIRGCSLLSPPLANGDKDKAVSAWESSRTKQDGGTLEIDAIARSLVERPRVPLDRTLPSLAKLAEVWCDPSSEERRCFEDELCRQSFFSPGSITEGLNRTFSAVRGEHLAKAAGRAWDGKRPETSGRLACFIPAGNLPVTGVFDYFAAFLAGTPALHRISARGGNVLASLQATLAQVDPTLAAQTAVVYTPSNDDDQTQALFRSASLIVAQGDDATLEHLLTLAPLSARFVPYGSRLSVALLPDTNSDAPIEQLVEDLFIWEQQGCLSPQVFFVPHERVGIVIERLLASGEALGRKWQRTPPRRALGIHRLFQGETEVGGLAQVASNSQLSLFRVDSIQPAWLSTPGLLQIVSYKTPEELANHLAPYRLGSLAMPPDRTASISLPFERVASFGELQSPSFDWAQEGIDRLAALCKTSEEPPL